MKTKQINKAKKNKIIFRKFNVKFIDYLSKKDFKTEQPLKIY